MSERQLNAFDGSIKIVYKLWRFQAIEKISMRRMSANQCRIFLI